ncbi:pyruvate/2-oxoglutarate dehydrogenase complex [Rhodobacterales bacterium]|nr:pyruvate/2-oxoglutarate dehydrogenase complex [Rhodobacterales bacterium]
MIKGSVYLVVLTVFLAGCASLSPKLGDVPIAEEMARLKGLGFRKVTQTAEGTVVLQYSGPVTSAVECRQGSSDFAPVPARRRLASGQTQTITLDAYLRLSPGQDGILTKYERDGIYVMTIRRSGGGRRTLSGTTFGPLENGSLASGLTCRAA